MSPPAMLPSSQLSDTGNLILIGMPGAGKSTVGVLLAKEIGWGFIDTDLLIQTDARQTLQAILDACGHQQLREIEARVLLGLDENRQVISTGGSAVYSDRAMQHLKKDGTAVFIDVSLPVLEQRVDNYATRGIAKAPEQSFAQLFEQRRRLYQRYADITVAADNLTPANVVREILSALHRL